MLTSALAGVVAAVVAAAPAVASDLGTFEATKVCSFSDDRLAEISGMALSLRHPDVLWAHADSGGGPYVYAIDADDCSIRSRLAITGADGQAVTARDFEAMAVGRDPKGRAVLWLADIGDNLDSWPHVTLLRMREPDHIADGTVRAREFRVEYEDGPRDAEALLADPVSGRMWIVTKKLAQGRLYALPKRMRAGATNTATFVRKERGLVTDGAVSPDGSRYVLRDYVDATVFTGLPPGTDPQIVPLPLQPQGEAIAWTADGTGLLIASERDRRLLRVPVPVPEPVPEPVASPATVPPSAPATSAPESSESPPAQSGGQAPVLVAVALVGLAAALIALVEVRRRKRA